MGITIQKARTERKLNLQMLAIMTHINPGFLGDIEAGIVVPSFKDIYKISYALGYDLSTFFALLAR
ncbi:MAG: helix-turn-helix domain-containing protein [Chloroflexi bacterium]|nr:helix-turn-helix domain-containing protein [Chloroflexota bacterium]